MITINANGQILSMCQCDQLVSDSIDVLEVQFVFDSAWAGMVKTAQFTQKNKETNAFDTFNVLIDDLGLAYVPNEITDGVCIISVFGVLGGRRITTAPLAVSVLKSGYVADGLTPIPPTPDLYQQLLEEFQARSYELPTASAVTLGGVKVGQRLAVSADGTLSVEDVPWENVTGRPETFPIAMDLIWENADIASDFAAQNITLTNKADYMFFVITMQPSGTTLDAGNCVSAIVINGAGNTLLGIVNSKLARRRVNASWTNVIQIGTGYTFDEYGSAMVEKTSVMKPVYIYGVR